MALPKITEARALSDEELQQVIADTKRKLFELRLKKATGQEIKTHEFKHNKHRLAQLMTVEKERELVAAKAKKQEKAPEKEPEMEPEMETVSTETEAEKPEPQPEE